MYRSTCKNKCIAYDLGLHAGTISFNYLQCCTYWDSKKTFSSRVLLFLFSMKHIDLWILLQLHNSCILLLGEPSLASSSRINKLICSRIFRYCFCETPFLWNIYYETEHVPWNNIHAPYLWSVWNARQINEHWRNIALHMYLQHVWNFQKKTNGCVKCNCLIHVKKQL